MSKKTVLHEKNSVSLNVSLRIWVNYHILRERVSKIALYSHSNVPVCHRLKIVGFQKIVSRTDLTSRSRVRKFHRERDVYNEDIATHEEKRKREIDDLSRFNY